MYIVSIKIFLLSLEDINHFSQNLGLGLGQNGQPRPRPNRDLGRTIPFIEYLVNI